MGLTHQKEVDMKYVDLPCTICRSRNKVIEAEGIYTIGSEGTMLCEDCRMKVVEFIRNLRGLYNDGYGDAFKQAKRRG